MKKTQPKAVVTAILTLITIVSWAGFEVYRSFTVKPAPPVADEIINPLDPTLDTKSLDAINGRKVLNDTEIGTIQVASSSPTPTSLATPTSSASPSGTPTVTPSPTPTP